MGYHCLNSPCNKWLRSVDYRYDRFILFAFVGYWKLVAYAWSHSGTLPKENHQCLNKHYSDVIKSVFSSVVSHAAPSVRGSVIDVFISLVVSERRESPEQMFAAAHQIMGWSGEWGSAWWFWALGVCGGYGRGLTVHTACGGGGSYNLKEPFLWSVCQSEPRQTQSQVGLVRLAELMRTCTLRRSLWCSG